MAHAAPSNDQHAALLSERLVRYEDLRPCLTAFIDTRTPGSKKKENFTIIGPGVAENPDQYVHIDTPHGFNIGGARQPPGCVNSQHSHETAEVFVVHSGTWAFLLGPNKEDGRVVLRPGDTISIPVHVFRGFENVGDDVGFLFAVLGGDDPGHVTWAPYVFDQAAQHGLVLLEDGSLFDTTEGDKIPDDKRAMQPTTEEDLARFNRLTAADMAGCVLAHEQLQAQASSDSGISEYPIIGSASPEEGLAAGRMAWPHGFHLRYVFIEPDTDGKRHIRHEEEVIMMFKGRMTVALPSGEIDIGPGDVLTVPVGMPRRFSNRGQQPTEAYVVRGGDNPRPPAPVS